MIRAPMGDKKYWDDRVNFAKKNIKQKVELLSLNSVNSGYDPQFSFNLTKFYLDSILRHYSRGDAISELNQQFADLLDAWELSNKLAGALNASLKSNESWDHRHLLTAPMITNDQRGHNDPRSWKFELSNLNHYNWCFWLVGLALSLEVPDDQWQRLLALIGGEGEDALLDRIISSRQLDRKVGDKLLHKKPYARLLKAVVAKDKSLPQTQQAELLRDFVQHWYIELERKGNNELWWYIYGDPIKHPLEMGSYFGRWCIEAVAAVKAFGLDDSLCLGLEHYPGDLLHTDDPSTYPEHIETKYNWFKRLLGK